MSSTLTPGTVIGDNQYVLKNKLGFGAHGDVYLGKDLDSEEEVACKLEGWDCEQLFLSHEYQVYKILEGGRGFPKAQWFGQEKRHNIMIIDLLGPSLNNVFQSCGNQFSLKTVLMLADQIFDRVEFLHGKKFIHRSIKPENFSIGLHDPAMIYMIDFGNAKRYINKSGGHIKCKIYEELGVSNCHSRHQSIAALQRMERSRKDDLESVGYMLVYFLKGALPWDNVLEDPATLKAVKMGTSVEAICEGCPQEFAQYMTYVRSLQFEADPDYNYIRSMFKKLSTNLGIQYDGKFDWVKQEEKRIGHDQFAVTAAPRALIHSQER